MKVIYVVLVCLLAFTSCAETEYAENGVDKKNITGYTEVGFIVWMEFVLLQSRNNFRLQLILNG